MIGKSIAARVALLVGVAALTGPAMASGDMTVQDPAAYLLPEAEEVALSRSAAPSGISDEAAVLVLARDGTYRTAVAGSNGWTCFTGRSWTGPAPSQDGKRVWISAHFEPQVRAPQCFNEAATGSMLALHRLTTRMFMQGASTTDVDLAIGRALSSGTIQPPEPGAMSYMHSRQQRIGPRLGPFRPHLMLYTPYVSQEAYGERNDTMTVPMVAEGGTVFATTVVMSSHWSDGTPVE